MKNKYIIIVLLFLLLFLNKGKAQLSGTYSVPSTFLTNIKKVIDTLNWMGVSGPVTINISAGHTETVPVNGFSLYATGTSTSPIIFQKNGTGPNPALISYTGGISLPNSSFKDGVWRLIGCDHITIDGIDIKDNNLANPATMEFGYGLFRKDASNGCQYNTIKNCSITLNRNNWMNGSYGSIGIEMVGATSDLHISSITPTVFAGTNSNNRFYNNTITNCNTGAYIHGVYTTSLLSIDSDNDIGGSSLLDGNKIINFGGGTATLTGAAGIITEYQKNLNISFNYVDNNNGQGSNHPQGIVGLQSYSSYNCVISSNTVSLKGKTTSTYVYPIQNLHPFYNFIGDIKITNNLVTNCIDSAVFSTMHLIENSSPSNSLNINNNQFKNIVTTGSQIAIYAINNSGSVAVQSNINNNELSNSNIFNLGFQSLFKMIYNTGGGTLCPLSICGNSIHSSVFSGLTQTFSLVHTTANASSITINNNSFDNNSASCVAHFISEAGWNAAGLNICNNVIRNFTVTIPGVNVAGISKGNNNYGTVNISNNYFGAIQVAGSFNGITAVVPSSPLRTINSNTFINITSTNTNSNIYIMNAGTGIAETFINNNLIQDLTAAGSITGFTADSPSLTVSSNTLLGFQASLSVYGMSLGGGDLFVFKNKLASFETNSLSINVITGMGVSSNQGIARVYNNIIGNFKPAPFSFSSLVRGMEFGNSAGYTTYDVCFNTIFLTGASSGGPFDSQAMEFGVNTNNGKLIFRNNIAVNTYSGTGTGTHVAVHCSNYSYSYDSLSNNNLLYAGSPSTSHLIFRHGAVDYQTLQATKIAMSPSEANSVTEYPPFLTTNPYNPYYLKLSSTVPTQAESGAVAINGIANDVVGSIRNVNTPDIGAWEGSYLILDSVPPTITGLNQVGACNLSGITLTANIVDASGIATGSLSPRCYYKINSNPYTSVQGSLTAGNTNNGIWTFTPSYAAVPGNTLTYFIVAQDVSTLTNIGSMPNIGLVATSVNNITTPPSTPYTTAIVGVLNGIYNVGSSGFFTTLSAAALAYNTWCITGPVTFSLTDPLYSSAENFPITFLNPAGASSTHSLLIRPATGNNAVITSTPSSPSVLKFLNSRYITIDGVNSGGSNIIINNGTSSNSSGIWLASTSTVNAGNKHITLQNLEIKGSVNTQTNFAIIACAEGSVPAISQGANNDSITIIGNTILRSYYGICATGFTNVISGGVNNWNVTDNIIGPTVAGPDNIVGSGIVMENALSSSLSKNTVRNIRAIAVDIFGLSVVNTRSLVVSQNTISAISSTAPANGINAISGLNVAIGSTNNVIEGNTISGVENNSTFSFFGARGINLVAWNGVGNRVYNNMISNISGGGLTTINSLFGIAIDGNSKGFDVDNNTVHMNGSYPGWNGATWSAALYLNSNATNLRLRNNILCNSFDNTNSTTDVCYSIYSDAGSSNFASIDNNDFSVSGSASSLILGFQNNSNQNSLPAIQSSFGGNMNSKTITPVFVSSIDLHLIPSSNVTLNDLGNPIVGISNDIDLQSRSALTPDMGADEFFTFSCNTPSSAAQPFTSINSCNGQTISLAATPNNGNGIVYQWMVSSTPSGPYSNVVGGLGASTTNYTTGILNTGNYYFVLKTTCTVSSLNSISNEATVSINPIPTVSIASNAPICAGSSLTLNGSSNIGTLFQWSGPGNYTSSVQNPTLSVASVSNSGIYTLTATQLSCSSTTTNTISVVAPTIAVSNNGPYCVGNTIQLSSLALPNYSWTGPSSFSSNLQNPSLLSSSLGMSGNYTLIASVGNCTALGTTSVSVFTVPTATASSSTNSVCSGTSLTLNSGTGTNYYWSGPGSFASALQSPTIFATALSNSGVFTVIVSNGNYCSTNATLNINVIPSPTVAISSLDSLCLGDAIVLTASGANTYSWSTASTSSTVFVSPITNSIYSVIGTSNNCSSTSTKTIIVNPLPALSASTSSNPICSGQFIILTASGGNNYTWTPGGWGSSIADNPSVTTTYTLVGDNSHGCFNTVTLTQTVAFCMGVSNTLFTEENIIFFPNPNQGKFFLKFENKIFDGNIILINSLGEIVHSQKISGKETEVDLKNISEGLYQCIVSEHDQVVYRKKIIIE